MPEFTYTGEAGQYYPTLPAPANEPEPGGKYDLADDPGDGRWTSDKPHKPAHTKSAEPKAEES